MHITHYYIFKRSMDINDIKRFLNLAQCLNFNQASTQCLISQSALSRTISRIEEEFSIKLFDRDNRSVTLTKAGLIFKEYAENFLYKYEKLEYELKNLNHPLTGKIKLYCSVTASLFLLPPLLNRFRMHFPNIEISVETGDAGIAIEKVISNNVDLAIAAIPKKLNTKIITIDLTKIPLVFIAPIQIPNSWLIRNQIDWQNVPYIMSEHGELKNELNNWFIKHKITKPSVYAKVAGHEAIASMVALGLGIALIPQAVIEQSILSNSVQTILVPDDITPFNVSLCLKPQRLKQEPLKTFIELITTNIK